MAKTKELFPLCERKTPTECDGMSATAFTWLQNVRIYIHPYYT